MVRSPIEQSLLESNRRALLKLLNDKIETIRAPYQPSCSQGHEVRRMKLEEATAYLTAPQANTPYTLLQNVAVAHNISMADAAELIQKRVRKNMEVLTSTERLRERLTVMITLADNQELLLKLRATLLEDVYPELSQDFKFVVPHLVLVDKTGPLNEVHRLHEISRLKAQLREKITC